MEVMGSSVDDVPLTCVSIKRRDERKTLSYLPNRPPVDIEFTDLSYTVPQGRKGKKIILRSVSGLFRSGQLTAILGPSGAGKSTLLNVLAGYRYAGATGSVLVNGQPRNMVQFQKMSRYIMQQDLVQPHLSVHEAMRIAADLKLGSELTKKQKLTLVDEIIEMLLLVKAKNTKTSRLSGGERKRLSIALELINNPPVIFLDEPTTGLDDLSSSQCISLLKMLAQGGRTVICSVHTPSAKLFAMFDHVYVVAAGQCVFQGSGADIVPFLYTVGIECPTHYNPADFVIEVSSGEYGDFLEKMVAAVDNGHCYCWSQRYTGSASHCKIEANDPTEDDHKLDFSSSCWQQIRTLTCRMLLQMYRDRSYLYLQGLMYLFLIFIIGSLYYNMGFDGAKQLYNFGFCYTCIIVFLYLPMLPVLLHFPSEVQLLKREHFNRWYSLRAYFCALSIAKLPLQIFIGTVYVCSVYWISNQPLELARLCQFLVICLLIGFVSENLGLTISSRLDIVNSIFIGPVLSVPLMLFAVYGMGAGTTSIPIYMRVLMCLSYLRFGFEGLMYAVYGNDRSMMPCPPEEIYCHFRSPKTLLLETGMENSNIWVAVLALTAYMIFFKAMSYFLLRWRLSRHRDFAALNYVGRIIKTHFNFTQQHK
ncbi:ATP-binding cassette sub-family G member 1 [Cryptotermes secundus]|uniref:ATP-binding cassette sub-family G member 1 n=2 Tax=Cryptotermes secundus TaxID=105785 RepID=A0A2J7R8N9_9NEOP|nr:ATP-binding cassette sub-family G member 1 isoform X1 [Cryptotermes secundus]PNF37193.1 ATP-binding cassette sub-family G member 1 [Cryptotermes secundus]